MLIIATTLAVAAPSLRGWNKGSKLRDEVDQFLSVTRYARTEAIASATPHRLVIEESSGRYWLLRKENLEFVNFVGEFGQEFTLPDGYRLALQLSPQPMIDTPPPTGEAVINFSPLGQTDPARVMFTAEHGQTVSVACATPYDVFRVITSGAESLR